MRQYWSALALAFMACGSPDAQRPADAKTQTGCTLHPPGPECPSGCGNHVIDTCYVPVGEGGCTWAPMQEACDGNTASCSALGFSTGTATCTQSCHVNTASCDACFVNATTTSCAEIAVAPRMLSVASTASGQELASAGTALEILGSDLTQIAVLAMPIDAIVAIPNGWIVSSNGSPSAIDAAGVSGPLGAAIDSNALNRSLAYGAGGRAIEAWVTLANDGFHAKAAILDTTGATLVAPFDVDMPQQAEQDIRVASDGTSFFAMVTGTLYRLGANGSVLSSTPGFPHGPQNLPHYLGWGATGGWYATSTAQSGNYVAQRFDATGAAVGTPIALSITLPALANTAGFAIDGDDLIAFDIIGNTDVKLIRVTPTGAITTSPKLGKGGFAGSAARVGADLVVGWPAGDLGELARVAF